MDAETKDKLKSILLRTKLSQFVSADEQAFARQCWREWPKEYSAIQTEEVHPQAAKRIASTQRKSHSKPAQPRTPRRGQTRRTPGRGGRRT